MSKNTTQIKTAVVREKRGPLSITAWSFASVFGPLYMARMRETIGKLWHGTARDRGSDGRVYSIANHRPQTASRGFRQNNWFDPSSGAT